MNKKRKLLSLTITLLVFFLTNIALAATLDNPLGTDDLRIFIGRLIKGILGLSGSVALLMFIYGGVVYLTAQGENERIQRAKSTLTWATVGLAVIFGSYAFLNYLFAGLKG